MIQPLSEALADQLGVRSNLVRIWAMSAIVLFAMLASVTASGSEEKAGPNASPAAESEPRVADKTTTRSGEQRLAEGNQLVRLAEQAIDKRDFQRAESQLRQALACYKDSVGDNSRPYTRTLALLGSVHIWRGELKQAEEYLQQALDKYRRLVGEDATAFVDTQSNLAGLYMKTESYEQAKPLLLRVLDARKRQCGEQHLDYAGSLNNLALL